VPDLELVNQENSLVDSFAPKQAQVYPDGGVFWSRVGSLNVLCAFSGIVRHPFDENECTIDMAGWARSGLVTNFTFLDPPITWGGTGTARNTYQEYKVMTSKSRTSRTEFFYPCCPNDPWPTLSFTLAFRRTTTKLYLRTLTIPVMLLTILASAVFWFDVRCGERLGYGITILLSITAVEIIAAESLPTCPEFLWIEAFMSFSFAFSVICLLESCYVTYLYFRQRQEDLTEWIKTGEDKKNEGSSPGGADDDLSFFTADIPMSTSFSKDKQPNGVVFPESRQQSIRDQQQELMNDDTERSGGSKLFAWRKRNAEDRWAAARNLDPKQFELVRKIDAWSFRIFLVSYLTFVITMFATIPLWKDDYQVDPVE